MEVATNGNIIEFDSKKYKSEQRLQIVKADFCFLLGVTLIECA